MDRRQRSMGRAQSGVGRRLGDAAPEIGDLRIYGDGRVKLKIARDARCLCLLTPFYNPELKTDSFP